MSLIDVNGAGGVEGDQDSRYAFLASDDQFNADDTDFSDPAALLARQRKILA